MDTDPVNDGETVLDETVFDDRARDDGPLALAACLFSAPTPDHLWWTVLVADPALRDTASHLRLVGHYPSELEALDAADHLAAELNGFLLPGEAPLTVTPIGIEAAAPAAPSAQLSRERRDRISPI